ncbi:MAG: alanine:cation symporter family protein, partial [Oscillospiraceae bacterium]|nr:alanine:cation symporter family protein [Oscillospiraceae bacterium]
METFNEFIKKVDDLVWGLPLIILIIGCGILLTIRLRGIQVHKLGTALKYMFQDEENAGGEVSSFQALCTALSATIGTGNIVGVATALAAGGPGALLWMEVAAFFGMATKYSEGLLSIKYRIKDKNGQYLGGPFYYIERGMGEKWKWLGKLFAVFGMLAGLMGIGTITQINGIASAANNFFDPEKLHTVSLFGMDYTWTQIITGLLITVFVALIVIGGIKRIASVSEIIVPVMVVLYIGCCLLILITHITEIPAAVVTIVESAFGIRAAAGGVLGAVFASMQSGIARGIFS